MYIATRNKLESPIAEHITTLYIDEIGADMEIFKIEKKYVDSERLIDYIGNSTVIDLKDKTVKVFYKGRTE